MNDHDFCRASLNTARAMAREAHVKIPSITAWGTSSGTNRQYQIFVKGGGCTGFSTACCAWEAKAQWILRQLDKAA